MRFRFAAGAFVSILLIASIPARAQNPPGFTSKDASVDGLKLHYTTGGHGTAVILLHGFAETSRIWTPILPVLGEKFTVIAPDLPGIGDSSIPANGINMKDAAIAIHSLVRSLGIQKARVVGHDIGLMVAYAYAAQFPSEVEKLVVMDAFLPGVEGWEPIYNNRSGISDSTAPSPKRWWPAASQSTFLFSGMTWPQTRTVLCPKPTAKLISKHIRDLDA